MITVASLWYQLLANFTLLVGDNLRFPSFRAHQQASLYSNPWYSYSFEYRGTLGYSYYYTGSLSYGSIVCHEDEMLYIFSQENSEYFSALNETLSDTDLEMVDRMVEMWTSFVKIGWVRKIEYIWSDFLMNIIEYHKTVLKLYFRVPHSDALGNASWPRFSTSKQHLRIGNGADPSFQVRDSDSADRAKFWDTLTEYYYWYRHSCLQGPLLSPGIRMQWRTCLELELLRLFA